MVTIIDYGLGNLASIKNMLKKIGTESVITSSVEQISIADKLILPGVGHFAKGMENLQKSGLVPVMNDLVLVKKIPILGICLGMQLMTSFSEEGNVEGLGWINANTIKFKLSNSHYKIPHMGWANVNFNFKDPLAISLQNLARFYFVHSYHVKCSNDLNILATSNYEDTFHSAFVKDNIRGVQFHPEKSHKFGMQLLKNFSNLNQ
jgi:glutamine amidotransferase